MERIDKLVDNLEQLLGGKMEEFVEAAGEKQKDLMIELNQLQLDAGERADGSKIEPPYTETTVQIKRGKGQPTNKVTLFDQGNFYNSEKVFKYQKAFVLEFTDEKTEALIKKYGEGIEGLNQDHLERVSEAMLPDLHKMTKNYLQV